MQDILNRINKIQDEWNKPIDLNFREPTQAELDQINAAKEESKKQAQIQTLKTELTELDKDFIQAVIGYSVPDLANRKARFNELYTELCALEGKEPRSKENEK